MATTTDNEHIIDRDIGELFLVNADDPIKTHVMGLAQDWWETAPESAIQQYVDNLRAVDGADAFLEERYLPDTTTVDDLEPYAPGSLGHAYKHFIVDHGLGVNLARNHHDFHAGLAASGKLDRMPEDIGFAFVRGFMLHDFLRAEYGDGTLGTLVTHAA